MSREIKFRAWDKKRKCWICFEDYFESLVSECTNIMILSNNVEWIQFTGLHDRNGKEIWEGDIVSSDEYPFTSKGFLNYRGIIYWDDEKTGYFVYLYAVSNRVSGRACGIGLSEYDSLVVVGNRFEHSELLEVKQITTGGAP